MLVTVPIPRLRSFIVNWLNPLGADPQVLARRPASLRRTDSARRGPPAPKGRRLQRPQSARRSRSTTAHGRHPFPPRDLDPAGADSGTGNIRDRQSISRASGSP